MKTNLILCSVFSRIFAALLGGYVFTYNFTAALARLLPMAKADAVIVATLPAFLVYSSAILWAIGCRNGWFAWLGAALAIPLGMIGFWPQILRAVG